MVNRATSSSPALTAVIGLAIFWAATFVTLVLLSTNLRNFWWLLLGLSLVGACLTLLARPQQPAGRRPPKQVVVRAANAAKPVSAPPAAHPAHGATPADDGPPSPVGSGAEVTAVRAERAGRTTGNKGSGIPITTSALTLAKAGNTEAENEDAFAVAAGYGRVAVSDGASSAYRSAEWARALCTGFVDTHVDMAADEIADWLVGQARAFQRSPAGDAGWWDAVAVGRGAFATIVAVEFHTGTAGPAWRAVAVGDSVLLQLRPHGDGYVLVAGFPIESGEAFTSTPALVSSTVTAVTEVPTLRFAHGRVGPSDRWLALTDELARWALRAQEAGMPIWTLLLSGSPPEIVDAITRARQQGNVVNDDMTLVRIAVA